MEIDYKLDLAKSLAERMYMQQTYYNAKVQPPADWETIWVAESARLVELTEGKDPYLRWFMLIQLVAISQVKYATKYTSPALIAEHIPELAEQVFALQISGDWDTTMNMYLKALGSPTKDDEQLDAESLERKAKERRKEAETGLKAWNNWMAKHRQIGQSEANVA